MKLELHCYDVSDVRFAPTTSYDAGVLAIDRDALTALLTEDPRLEEVSIGLARPHSSTRIANVFDVLEPRVRRDTRTYFPGMLGALQRAGDGVTHALKGVTVVEAGTFPGFMGGLIDMSGPAAEVTALSRMHHVCVVAKAKDGIERRDYAHALKTASMKAAVYLAETTLDAAPDRVEVYDLDGSPHGESSLPAVGYLLQLHSHAEVREPFLYGDHPRHYYPTILHPNEILDGAIICGAYDLGVSFKNISYAFLNHPVIKGLYARHGTDVDFRGVVIAPEPVSLADKHRTSMMSAALLKDVLGVDGVIITKEGGGHTDVDLMENCDACENIGIRTVLIDNEWLGVDGSSESPLIAFSERADAMASVGNIEEMLDLPPLNDLIGGYRLDETIADLRERVKLQVWSVVGAVNQLGLTYLRTELR